MHCTMEQATPFPPAPRAWREFVDEVLHDLVEAPAVELAWEPVHLLGLDSPWVGVRVPELHTHARGWVWDVVTPEDHERERSLHDDPLALAVAQDTMVLDVHRDDDATVSLRLQVPVREVPWRIDVPSSAVPPSPWRVELSTGWTSASIDDAISRWYTSRLGVHRCLRTGSTTAVRRRSRVADDDNRFLVGDGLYAEGASMDVLLQMAPADAARITTLFGAVIEALAPWR